VEYYGILRSTDVIFTSSLSYFRDLPTVPCNIGYLTHWTPAT
jgi:hypothetical protein